MQIRYAFFILVLAIVALTCGCSGQTVGTFTNIHADGSYERMLEYKTNGPAETSTRAHSKAELIEAKKHNRADDFVLAKSGEWKNVRSNADGEDQLVSSRSARSGVTVFDDMGLKQNDPTGKRCFAKPLVGNRVTVTRTADGHLEYHEILHWNGSQFAPLNKADAGVIAILKPYLPLATRQNHAALAALAVEVQQRYWECLFSPPHPVLPEILASPDYGEYAISRQLRPIVSNALSAHCGGSVAVTAAGPIADRLARYCLTQNDSKKPDSVKSSDAGADIDALFYRVRFPGKVILSNGEVDAESNEVVWSLYTVATCPRDITLTATCEANGGN